MCGKVYNGCIPQRVQKHALLCLRWLFLAFVPLNETNTNDGAFGEDVRDFATLLGLVLCLLDKLCLNSFRAGNLVRRRGCSIGSKGRRIVPVWDSGWVDAQSKNSKTEQKDRVRAFPENAGNELRTSLVWWRHSR